MTMDDPSLSNLYRLFLPQMTGQSAAFDQIVHNIFQQRAVIERTYHQQLMNLAKSVGPFLEQFPGCADSLDSIRSLFFI